MLRFLQSLLIWWQGATPGTLWTIRRNGEFVGTDEFGNRYFRSRGGAKDPALGHERRWVIYNGEAEASMIPPGWHGWMHHRTDVPPTKQEYATREWQLPHLGNQTGTAGAYRPSGSTLGSGQRPAATGDYQAWAPGE